MGTETGTQEDTKKIMEELLRQFFKSPYKQNEEKCS
jgi:hypothetical protein